MPETTNKLKKVLLIAFAVGLIAHGYAFLNFQPSHDSLWEAVSTSADSAWKIELGRYLQPLYAAVFGRFVSFPWSNSLIALLWMALAEYFLVDILQIQKTWQIIITCGVLSANITVIAIIASFSHDFGPDMLALFFAMLGCWIWYKTVETHDTLNRRQGLIAMVLIACCVAASLALYQAFICVFISVILIASDRKLLSTTESVWKSVWMADAFAACATILGGIIYYIGLKLATRLTGIALFEGSYNSVSNAWQNKEPFKDRLIDCIHRFKQAILEMPGYVYPDAVAQGMNILLLVAGAAAFCAVIIYLVKHNAAIGNIVTAVLFSALLPFAMNGMRLLNTMVHDLMTYALCMVYIFVLVVVLRFSEIYKNQIGQITGTGVCILLMGFVLMNIQTANAAYVKKTTEQEATLSVMTRVVDRVESIDGYVPGVTPVLIVGTPDAYLQPFAPFDQLATITGLGSDSSISTSGEHYQNYFKMIMRVDINLIYEMPDDTSAAQIDAMPAFPEKGSVQKVGGAVVVKFE